MSGKKSLNHYLMRFNRLVVWILLFYMVMFIVTGYGLSKPETVYTFTGGLLNYNFSLSFHTLMVVPLSILLLIHVIIEVKFSLMRWGFRNQRLLNYLMLLLGSSFLVLTLYMWVV